MLIATSSVYSFVTGQTYKMCSTCTSNVDIILFFVVLYIVILNGFIHAYYLSTIRNRFLRMTNNI